MPIQKITSGVIDGTTTFANTAISGTITASQIATVNASTVTTGTLPGARLPTGSILQVISSTNITNTTTSGGTYVDTGLTASITPLFSTSKILVLISANVGCSGYNAGFNGITEIQIVRASTSIYVSQLSTYNYASGSGGISCNVPAAMSYVDSPATTSSTTYKIQFKNTSGSSAYFNDGSSDSTITLMEIAQ